MAGGIGKRVSYVLMLWDTWCNRFATDEALREIHRVLKPGGTFGMIWNIDDCEIFFFSFPFDVLDEKSLKLWLSSLT